MFIALIDTSWNGILFTMICAGLFLWLGASGYWIAIGVIVTIVLVLLLIIGLAPSSNKTNKK